MKVVELRSPFIIEINEAGQNGSKIELFIWNGYVTPPTTPSVIRKPVKQSDILMIGQHNINYNNIILLKECLKKNIRLDVLDNDNRTILFNIVKFNCMTLGVSTFPWNQIILNKSDYPMFVFIDYKTIHPDLSSCKFNNSRTIIHEIGHVFGLKHIFKNNSNALDCYKIILGQNL